MKKISVSTVTAKSKSKIKPVWRFAGIWSEGEDIEFKHLSLEASFTKKEMDRFPHVCEFDATAEAMTGDECIIADIALNGVLRLGGPTEVNESSFGPERADVFFSTGFISDPYLGILPSYSLTVISNYLPKDRTRALAYIREKTFEAMADLKDPPAPVVEFLDALVGETMEIEGWEKSPSFSPSINQ